jgi:glycosyltransferase involved in cell wall biosynthesis
VFHLLGRQADFQTQRALDAISRDASIAQADQAAIGPGGKWINRLAAFMGLRREAADFDAVHCWDERALSVAALAGAKKIIFSPQSMPRKADIRWLRAIMGYRDVQVVCPSITMHRRLVSAGVPLERCHLIRPGVDFSRIRSRRDDALRAELGIAPDDFVVLAPGESTDASNHFLAAWATSVHHVLADRWRFLMWGRGPRANCAANLAKKLGQPRLLIVAEEKLGRRVEFESLLPATDVVAVTAVKPVPALPIACCMAAALPVVSTVESSVAELLEDRHTALMVTQPRPRLIVEKLMAIREDAALRRKIADQARTEAFELWAMTRFQNRWRRFYEQAFAGGAIEIEP